MDQRAGIDQQKGRGAFFTPPAIAKFLAAWAVAGDPDTRVLDPTCGEAVFLLAAGEALKAAGCATSDLDKRLYGVDIHSRSLAEATSLLEILLRRRPHRWCSNSLSRFQSRGRNLDRPPRGCR